MFKNSIPFFLHINLFLVWAKDNKVFFLYVFKVTEQVRGCVAGNFTKVPKPIYHFKAYRTKNDVEMFLTGEIEQIDR